MHLYELNSRRDTIAECGFENHTFIQEPLLTNNLGMINPFNKEFN